MERAVMRPLEGLKVLDLTQIYGGPFATMQLSDFGAMVIKVEQRGSGDMGREYPPMQNGASGFFATYNRGKQSITLDLQQDAAVRILEDLIRQVDVMILDDKDGSPEARWLDYAHMQTLNRELIYALLSGFGQSGSKQSLPCHDTIAQATSGIMEMTGFPGGPPTKVGVSIGESLSGIKLCLGILMALIHRDKTGSGQKIDVAAADALLAINESPILYYTVLGQETIRAGNSDATITPYEIYKAKDGYISIGVASEPIWPKFCKALHMEYLVEDDRYNTNEKRLRNYAPLKAVIAEYTRTKTKQELEARMLACNVPCAPVLSVAEIMTHPQLAARDMLVMLDDPEVGPIPVTGIPMKLTKSPGQISGQAPGLGEHTDEILKAAGYSEKDISNFRVRRIV
jgi:CoA:oxalate CoA-transferase